MLQKNLPTFFNNVPIQEWQQLIIPYYKKDDR